MATLTVQRELCQILTHQTELAAMAGEKYREEERGGWEGEGEGEIRGRRERGEG